MVYRPRDLYESDSISCDYYALCISLIEALDGIKSVKKLKFWLID